MESLHSCYWKSLTVSSVKWQPFTNTRQCGKVFPVEIAPSSQAAMLVTKHGNCSLSECPLSGMGVETTVGIASLFTGPT